MRRKNFAPTVCLYEVPGVALISCSFPRAGLVLSVCDGGHVEQRFISYISCKLAGIPICTAAPVRRSELRSTCTLSPSPSAVDHHSIRVTYLNFRRRPTSWRLSETATSAPLSAAVHTGERKAHTTVNASGHGSLKCLKRCNFRPEIFAVGTLVKK